MIYDNWMSYIKDEAHITKIAIPSAHNAGSRGMNFTACCQDGTLYEQYKYGVRHFCIRLSMNKKGEIVVAHGMMKGVKFTEVLSDMKRMTEEGKTEFFIFDIRVYGEQKLGPFKMSYPIDNAKVDKLLCEYLDPAKNAFIEFDNIADVTMGDIRRSGKRFMILNAKKEYTASSDCPHIDPWDAKVHGYKVEKFVKSIYRFIDDNPTDGFVWFQTQQTPNLGTENGIRKWPRGLDEDLRPYFKQIMAGLVENEYYLKNVNIIACDFYTRDYLKAREILRLNLLKGAVEESKREEYEKELQE